MSKHMLSTISAHGVHMDKEDREVSRSLGSYANKVQYLTFSGVTVSVKMCPYKLGKRADL